VSRELDLQQSPLVGAIAAIIKRYGDIQPVTEDEVLDALAYVYACVQRTSSGIHPVKLN
jgi:hypothetical protein